MMIVSTLLLLLVAQDPAAAAGTPHAWRPLGEPRPGFHLSFDPTPAARTGGVITVRVMTRYPAIARAPSYSVSMVEIRCGDGQARVVRTLSYAADGTQTRDDDVPVPFEPIPADSPFHAVRTAVC